MTTYMFGNDTLRVQFLLLNIELLNENMLSRKKSKIKQFKVFYTEHVEFVVISLFV